MNESARQIRQRLGIPEDATYVMVFDSAAHMDWDWLNTFPYNCSNTPFCSDSNICQDSARQLLKSAMILAAPPQPGDTAYYYSICEMSYLQAFVEGPAADPDARKLIEAATPCLRIVGGGITSPDCLLTSGEGFLRNYLLGKLWLAKNFPHLLPLKHCWIPDDFGQDPELPVAVRALGLGSIAFARMAGEKDGVARDPTMGNALMSNGCDFFWQASDRSTVYTHWMQGSYSQGAAIGAGGNVPEDISNYLMSNNESGSMVGPYSGAPTNYLFVPVADDFLPPVSDLLSYMDDWNHPSSSDKDYSDKGYPNTGVYAVAASFDDFAALVKSEPDKLKTWPLNGVPFNGTPYMTGFYASRPALKILHYGTTNLLLAAEALGLLAADGLRTSYWDGLAAAWKQFAPSTHHDYICGTAKDHVYRAEQLPCLQAAHDAAEAAANAGIAALAGSVQTSSQKEDAQTPVVIAGPPGVSGPVLVELALAPAGPQEIRFDSFVSPVQARHEGGVVFMASVPSTGYAVGYLTPLLAASPAQAPPPPPLPVQQVPSPPEPPSISPATSFAESYVLKNEHLSVTVCHSANWGISCLTDDQGNSVLADKQVGNDLVFYQDGGDIYEFGNEYNKDSKPSVTFAPIPPSKLVFEREVPSYVPVTSTAVVLEAGPVRVRLRTTVTLVWPTGNHTYTREYCLVAGEPFLRMTTTGSAPSTQFKSSTNSHIYFDGFSVMTSFPFRQKVDSIVQGTPCHWTGVQPMRPWPLPVFQATHRFLIPMSGRTQLAAIYHPEVPAWAFDQNGNLLGCLLRNTPSLFAHSAAGADPDSHTLRYAIRVPRGLGAPDTGQPLAEALGYIMPPQAMVVSKNSTGSLPEQGFLAQVTSGTGFVLAAKPGDVTDGSMIVRLYQPTNVKQTLVVTLGRGQPDKATAVTALEDPVTEDAPAVTILPEGFQIEMTNALATVEVVFGSSHAKTVRAPSQGASEQR